MGKGRTQLALCCPCGRPEILALGLCPTSYTLKRQDEEYFGGRGKRFSSVMATTAVVAGLLAGRNDPSSFIIGCLAFSTLNLMISLCPGCHAKVEPTKMVLSEMSPLLLVLWRE
jgi:hypothetical protein